MLSDHIEKLMMFLKHEATQKAKAHEQQRRLHKELELVKVTLGLVARFFQCCCANKVVPNTAALVILQAQATLLAPPTPLSSRAREAIGVRCLQR